MADQPQTSTQSVIAFFAELVGRLFSKTPAFFKVIQVISTIVSIVTGLPVLLQSVGITLPEPFAALENKVIAIAGLVSLFISSLPVSTPVATNGTTTSSSAALPFTAPKETKTT